MNIFFSLANPISHWHKLWDCCVGEFISISGSCLSRASPSSPSQRLSAQDVHSCNTFTAGSGWREESLLQSELALFSVVSLNSTGIGARDCLFLRLCFWALESESWVGLHLGSWWGPGQVAWPLSGSYRVRLMIAVRARADDVCSGPSHRHVQATEQNGTGYMSSEFRCQLHYFEVWASYFTSLCLSLLISVRSNMRIGLYRAVERI